MAATHLQSGDGGATQIVKIRIWWRLAVKAELATEERHPTERDDEKKQQQKQQVPVARNGQYKRSTSRTGVQPTRSGGHCGRRKLHADLVTRPGVARTKLSPSLPRARLAAARGHWVCDTVP